ncbi:MAG: hypothetical protein IKS35_04130 [Clostridia bacterium]|nr:hypothetical protein [Clostridia bacterium]
MDVSLKDKDGNKIQLEKPVTVNISLPYAMLPIDNYAVFTICYGVAQKLDIRVENGKITFSVNVFSPIAVVPAHRHAFGDWTTVKPATCSEAGTEERTCECGEVETRPISTLAHTGIVDEAVAPTCKETGLTEGRHCSVCGEVLIDQTEVPKTAHTEVVDAAVPPSCSKTGLTEGKHCSVCNEVLVAQTEVPKTAHTVVTDAAVPPTCTKTGLTQGSHCSVCGEVIVEQKTVPMSAHNYVGGVCSACGKVETAYTRINSTFAESDTGNYILFGSYPQTLVVDETVTSALTSAAGTLPTNENSQKWTSYEYYIQDSNETDFMWYIDLSYGGERYRGVYFTSYRPWLNSNQGIDSKSYQDDNGFSTLTVYWFKFEPILWKILSETNGTALLFCADVIDCHDYYHQIVHGEFDHNGGTGLVCNYALSDIRLWLNDVFYETAFSALQKELITLTTVDNSSRSMEPDNAPDKTYQYNQACEDTEDRIFLLSNREITNEDYGFMPAFTDEDRARLKIATDYALCQGTSAFISDYYPPVAEYRLRSPSKNDPTNADYVLQFAEVDSAMVIFNTGIAPALVIRLSK